MYHKDVEITAAEHTAWLQPSGSSRGHGLLLPHILAMEPVGVWEEGNGVHTEWATGSFINNCEAHPGGWLLDKIRVGFNKGLQQWEQKSVVWEPRKRTGCIICKTQCKMNMQAHCFKIKNFTMASAVCYRPRAFLSVVPCAAMWVANPWSQPCQKPTTAPITPFESPV